MSASPVSSVLSYAEAAARVQAHAAEVAGRMLDREKVPLLCAAGRVLAEPMLADRDQPPFDRSTRDGFACRAGDLAAGSLSVVGQLRAGEAWTKPPLGSGEAAEIMTGAAVPPGANCVVMIEHVAVSGASVRLAAARALHPGDNIVPAGAEARGGMVVVPVGRRLGPPEIGIAASCGWAELQVYARSSVAILATGDELVNVQSTPGAHQIRNSNSYSLAAQVAAAGGTPRIFPIVRDDQASTEEAIERAAACDLILLTGGVSMGKFDFVEQALLALGAEFFFTGARIQPGKPVVFGKLRQTWFFGLPGNPLSTMVTFALFAAPLLGALGGEAGAGPRFVSAQLEEEVRVQAGLTRFLPATLSGDVRGGQVRRIAWQGSGDLAAAARANAFVVIPEDAERIAAGAWVSVLLL